MGDTGLDELAKDLAFEFGKHREHPGEGTPAQRRRVEGFGEGDTVNALVSKRFAKRKQMQWTKVGAHLLL